MGDDDLTPFQEILDLQFEQNDLIISISRDQAVLKAAPSELKKLKERMDNTRTLIKNLETNLNYLLHEAGIVLLSEYQKSVDLLQMNKGFIAQHQAEMQALTKTEKKALETMPILELRLEAVNKRLRQLEDGGAVIPLFQNDQ